MYRVLLALGLIAFVGCGSKGWGTKATLNERAASDRVGGFSPNDARLYHIGVQHVINKHQRIGRFTIGQIVDEERSRETQRSEIAQKARNAQLERAEKRRAAIASAAKVSTYAHSISLLLQLDYAASREIKDQAASYSMSGVYSVAEQTIEGVQMAQGGLREKMPAGFDRTQEAAEAYMGDMRTRYQATANLANDPTPKNSYAFRKANEYEYAGAVLKAFDADLADAQFPADLRSKLRSRIRGN